MIFSSYLVDCVPHSSDEAGFFEHGQEAARMSPTGRPVSESASQPC